MSSNLVGPELENDDNEMEDPKVDNFEEDQASVIRNKNKNGKYDASITPTKKSHT